MFFVCYTTALIESKTSKHHVVLEATEEVLALFLATVVVPDRRNAAMEDGALFTLMNGVEVHCNMGSWQRIKEPTFFHPAPTKCDLSGKELGNVCYDGPIAGFWGIVCEDKWKKHNGHGQLGVGKGQKYLRDRSGKFYLSEGLLKQPAPHTV